MFDHPGAAGHETSGCRGYILRERDVHAGSSLRGSLMKVGTLVGLLLIIAGAIGLIWGGITYTKNRETVGIGPIEVTATERETIPIGPIAGGIMLIAGIAIVVGTRRAAR